jgi:hypothetical protein
MMVAFCHGPFGPALDRSCLQVVLIVQQHCHVVLAILKTMFVPVGFRYVLWVMVESRERGPEGCHMGECIGAKVGSVGF